jgi:hypothetical protein
MPLQVDRVSLEVSVGRRDTCVRRPREVEAGIHALRLSFVGHGMFSSYLRCITVINNKSYSYLQNLQISQSGLKLFSMVRFPESHEERCRDPGSSLCMGSRY